MLQKKKDQCDIIITQHVAGHPASFDGEAERGPEHQDGDVVWSHSQSEACDHIQYVGHQETELPAKPAHRKDGILFKIKVFVVFSQGPVLRILT